MEPLLTVENAAFSYAQNPVFRGLSFTASAGEVLCILGANGCGKTTLLRCLYGALKLSEGRVLLGQQDVAAMSPTAVARTVGIVFQEHTAPFPFLVREIVSMGRAPHLSFLGMPAARDRQVALESMELMGVAHLQSRPYTEISGGERQMVLIARCLAQQPKILLFDEPTSHLDYRNQVRLLGMLQQLARRGLAVVLTTHHPDHALMYPTQVALMNGGRFIAKGAAEAVINGPNLKATYGIDIRVLSVTDGPRKYTFCVPELDAAETLGAPV
jgi:iron complex transport system ATP-binding protein